MIEVDLLVKSPSDWKSKFGLALAINEENIFEGDKDFESQISCLEQKVYYATYYEVSGDFDLALTVCLFKTSILDTSQMSKSLSVRGFDVALPDEQSEAPYVYNLYQNGKFEGKYGVTENDDEGLFHVGTKLS